MTKARDIADFKFENIVDTGTEGTKLASGTTAQRGSTTGQIRFNSTTNLAEYYDGSIFKPIDSPPTVASTDVTEVDSQAGGNQTIVITGTGFVSGATVTFVGANGTDFNASTVTVNSSTQITAVSPKASFLNAQEPYGVKVTNVSNLSASLSGQINVDTAPTWNTSSGSLGSFNNYSTVNVSATATDTDGDTVAYSIQSGSIPAGLSLNLSTGAITGTPTTVTNSTTSSFTLRATAGGKTADRAFTITINPVIEAFTSNGTWTVPSGITTVAILVVAGGGSGGTTDNTGQSNRGSAGGAGGVILIPNWNVSGASSYSITVGNGGAVVSGGHNDGQNSVVSGGSKTLTALGGGAGGFSDNTDNGRSGGSGGSSWYPTNSANSGTQPTNTSDGVTTYNSTGYGNASGSSLSGQPYSGGGGGAGGVGVNASDANTGTTTTDSQGNALTSDQGNALGGVGLYIGGTFATSYGEQGFVASGGTGAGYNGAVANFNSVSTKAHLGGGGIGHNASTSNPSNSQANGQANTGGGGGSGGNGGSGLVLIKY